MPRRSSDGQVLTWAKLADEVLGGWIQLGHDQDKNAEASQLAEKIAASGTAPTTLDDCWGVRPAPGDTFGYIGKRLAAKGEGNKHPVHR